MNASTSKESLALQASAHDAEDVNTSGNPSISDLIDARMSRRGLLRAGFGTAGGALLGSFALSACGGGDDAVAAAPAPAAPSEVSLGFTPVAKSLADAVVVPAGYTATVLYALGDPLTAGTPAYANDGTDTGFDTRAGDHHDGMEYFGLNAAGTARDPSGATRGLLAMNHEATSQYSGEIASVYLHADGGTNTLPRPAAEIDKEIPIHGLSVIEIRKNAGTGKFEYDKASSYNRRVTPLTPVQLSGPVRGNALVRTAYSATGNDARGTINNCGTGYTPWGTFLSGEENWAGYFTRGAADDAARGGAAAASVISLKRYGRNQGAASRHGWETGGSADKYARWDISVKAADATGDYRNELNTFGYIVEMDPYDQSVAIKKRTALGRFAHESASFGLVKNGKPLAVYMGDDSRGEYMYKFVSTATWADADASPASRIATGDKYLDSGKLYVAKFAADGTGQWIELNIANSTISGYAGYTFADQADVLVNARLAADAVGATKMDRPEWCAVHPKTGEIYYTLTNNSNRKVEPSGGSQFALDAANPRAYSDSYGGGAAGSPGNINGHIIRLKENAGESAATAFTWDVYLFGAQSDADPAKINLSALTADQDFSSPDGLWFSQKTGLCFIQTDDGAYTDVTNCMMLIAKPGTVGDGSSATLNYTKADTSTLSVTTRVGKKPTSDTLRRFLVGPKDCEITGCTETPDGRALFVNIQHPGETQPKATIGTPSAYLSHWPGNTGYGAGGSNARPRSATIVITKNDGGLIGS
jgi:secreted PhoX family phosphatase